jgi:tRNA (guanine37-N1)-methyltransferase
VLGRAGDRGLITVGIHDIRDHATNRHRTVDDAPYGGGAGMVMKVDVVAPAVEAVRGDTGHVILLTPTGRPFRQADARRLRDAHPHLVLICGHYEGIDARVGEVVDEEISLGDFVLTGGEIAACAIVDAVSRLVPGVLGNSDSPEDESFTTDLLEYPQYTRPREWRGHSVPDVLLSGHHRRIAEWRRQQAVAITQARRPDLYEAWSGSVDGRGKHE